MPFTKEERRLRHLATTFRWQHSAAGKEASMRYEHSNKARATRGRFRKIKGNARRNEQRAPGMARYAKELVDMAKLRRDEAADRENHYQSWTVADIERLELLHKQGHPARVIGLYLGRTTASVRTFLRKLKRTATREAASE